MTFERGAQLDLKKLAADTGCHVHPDCLTCPLSVCIYEARTSKSGGGYVQPANVDRMRRAKELVAGGMSVKATAEELGTDRRTVKRWLEI